MSVVLPAISREGSRGDISDAAKRQSHPDSPPRKRRARKKKAKAGDPKEIAAGAEIARALANIGNSSRTAAEIAVLQDMQDDVNRKLEKETDRDRELAVGLMELEKTLSKAKKAQGGVYFITKNTADLTKEVKNLEKRLDKARSNYNLAVDDNNRLRREIETTRHEIEAGDAMIKQEMAALTKKQLELRDLSEAMQSSYYRRDRAEADMHTMKADADAAEVSFRTQWTRLVRVMDEDAKRSHDEKRVKLKSQGDRVAEDRHKKTVIELERKIQSKKLDQKAQEKERTESLEQASNRKTALNQIFNATGVDNVDDLVDALLEKQERVNHDYKQMETIERELSAATYSVESMKAVQAGNAGKHQEAEGHRRRVEVQLDEQLKKVDAKGMDADGEVLAAGKIESNLYPKVQRIHELLRCGPRQSSLQIDPGPMDMARMMAMLAEIEPALMRLVHRMDGGTAPAAAAAAARPADSGSVDPDYVRMVEAAGGDDSELAAIRSELEAAAARAEGPRARSPSTGAQVPAWMNESRTNVSIQIPTIGGVDLDSSDDDDDDSERRFHKNDSPKTKVLTREQIKYMAERQVRKAALQAEAEEH